jgi:hypothetical protein
MKKISNAKNNPSSRLNLTTSRRGERTVRIDQP